MTSPSISLPLNMTSGLPSTICFIPWECSISEQSAKNDGCTRGLASTPHRTPRPAFTAAERRYAFPARRLIIRNHHLSDTETLLSLRYRKVDNTVTSLFLTHFPVRQLSVSASCVPLSSPHYALLICCFTLVKLELSNAFLSSPGLSASCPAKP